MNNNHASDCAVHSEPAYPAGPCDCHLSIALRLDELMTHAYQGSSEAADKIAAELVEIYKSMQPAMNPCAGRNCGSTNPNLHSAECFEDYEKATGMTMQDPVAWRDHVEQRLLTWRQSFVNKSGDQLALDDFMDKQSLDDLIDFVCDEYTTPPQRKPLTDEQEREAFEAHWYSFYHSGSIHARSDGSYFHPHVQRAWEAWQARAAQE